MAKKPGARLADFQCAGVTRGAPSGKRARRFDLLGHRSSRSLFERRQGVDQAAVEALAEEIDRLQDMLFADRRFKMLVVLQGTDTSGKDGTIRGVFSKTSALGVRTAAWKAPSEEERAHDFLWRIHQKVPGAGEMVVFNRSHYEDVLVPVIKGWTTREEAAGASPRSTTSSGCWPTPAPSSSSSSSSISKEEQRVRLQDRLDDPGKHWKFAVGDLEERTRWTPTRRHTARRWPRSERPGRHGRSSLQTPRPIAT